MKIIPLYTLMISLTMAAAQADQPVDTSKLPAGVKKAIGQLNGKVSSVQSRTVDGRTVYEVEVKQRGETTRTLLSENGSVIGDQDVLEKGKGKAKGKGKGKGNRGRDREVEEAAPAASAATPLPAAAPSPAQPQPPVAATAQPRSVAAASAAEAPKVQSTTKPPAGRSVTQAWTEMQGHIRKINTMENNPALAKAGLAAVSKETGIPVSRLESQLAQHPVGLGGLLVGNDMAKTSGKQPVAVLKERAAGRDWDRLAAENKYDLATALPKLQRVEQAMEAAQKKAKR